MTIFRIKNRKVSFFIVLAVYIVAFSVGFYVFILFSNIPILISTLLADVAATLVVWVFGILFANSSIYDPYWSVAPLAILLLWIIIKGISFSAVDVLFIGAIAIWGVRLTLNWAIRWKGLNYQDWRYTMLKEKSPRLWFFANLFGINLMPTIIVFIALASVYFGIGQDRPINFYIVIGFAVCMTAILVQAISDWQIDLFKKNWSNKDRYINQGLWKYSRHPNYLGEISFWWGIWLMQIGVTPQSWATVAGPILVTLLFIFVSIPMMEKHILATRPAYSYYQEQVSLLNLMPRRIK
jgi:steroid 5-alpha reductase family enzyme